MESLGDFQQQKLSTDNIMTERLPQFIRFKSNNIDIAENSKRKLRKIYGLSFKGLKKPAQRKLVVDYATELRGTGKKLKGVRYAYRYLAQAYNAVVETQREEILEGRKFRKSLEKKLILFKLGKTGKFCIDKETLTKLGARTVVEIISNILTGEMVVLSVKQETLDADGISEGYVYYTLSQSNINDLINALSTTEEQVEMSSDAEFAGAITEAEELCIEYPKMDEKDFDKSGNIKTKKGGAFFKYLNHTDFELWEYGVFKEVIPDNYKENCLYIALKYGGLCEEKLNKLHSFVVNRDVPISKLKAICDKLHICIRLRKNDKTDKAIIYGKEHTDIFEIGLIDRHYFIIEKVDFTMFALKNYFDLRDNYEVDEMKYFYRKRGNSYRVDETRTTDSYKVIKFLLENKEEYLRPITFDKGILETQFIDRAFDIDCLEYDAEEDCKLNDYDDEAKDKDAYKAKRQEEWTKWFFDFESFKMRVENPNVRAKYDKILNGPEYKNKQKDLKELKSKMIMRVHKPYMCCAISEDGVKVVAYGDGCGKLMMNAICEKTNVRESGKETGKFDANWKRNDDKCKKVLMIAHNCNYDYRFLQKHLYNISQKTKGSGLMNATACYMHYKSGKKEEVRFQFKDSLKLIAMPLRKFGKCFGLKQEKEVFPYDLYTRGNLKENWIDVKKARQYLSQEDYDAFLHNVKKLKIVKKMKNKKLFNMFKYAEYYCMMDCKVLRNGYETFRGWIKEQINIDVDTVWTVASLADKYMKMNGVYDGVYALAGVPQLFIQKCVVGGRTMCRDNCKWKFDAINNKNHKGKRMADYDGVSLYPSSMYRMEGCLKGKPKILQEHQKSYDFLQQQDGYFVKIRITEVGIDRHFSLLSEVNENGVRVFHNDFEDKIMYVDKTTLEDMINFQEVKFEVLLGYYYNEGRNPLISSVIKKVFDLRLKLKKEKNNAQLIYKLIMNSSYGKTILKPINTEEVIVGEKEKDDFIRKNYNYIMEYEPMYESKNWRFKLHKTINEHFNNCCVGVEVLSMSKRIMNEVMCLCEDYHLTAYYTDTDSIHIIYDDVMVLTEKYKEKYGRELDGKQLGQFHIDFDLEDDKGRECDNVYAEKSIFLGKKCYIDCLVGTNEEGKTVRGHHIRMKGVPNSTIKYTADKLGISLYDLYNKLFMGERIKFDLLEGGKRCNFKFHNNGAVSSMNNFVRELGFN